MKELFDLIYAGDPVAIVATFALIIACLAFFGLIWYIADVTEVKGEK